jgi:hypothetical protein
LAGQHGHHAKDSHRQGKASNPWLSPACDVGRKQRLSEDDGYGPDPKEKAIALGEAAGSIKQPANAHYRTSGEAVEPHTIAVGLLCSAFSVWTTLSS